MLRDKYFVDKDFCASVLVSYIEENSVSYPMQIGDDLKDDQKCQLTLFLVRSHKGTENLPKLKLIRTVFFRLNIRNFLANAKTVSFVAFFGNR